MTVWVDWKLWVVIGCSPHIAFSWKRESERETERKVWEVNLQCKYVQHVSGVASCLSVCIWMCLRRQAASLFTQINIWHWLHGLWSAFHPIWTITVSAIHQAVSMYSPQGTNLWPAQSFYNHITSIIVPHHVHHGLNKHLYRETAYIHWHTNICTSHSHLALYTHKHTKE